MECFPLALTGVHHLQADLQTSIVDGPVVSVLQDRRVLRDEPPGQHPDSQGRLATAPGTHKSHLHLLLVRVEQSISFSVVETHHILFFVADPVRQNFRNENIACLPGAHIGTSEE